MGEVVLLVNNIHFHAVHTTPCVAQPCRYLSTYRTAGLTGVPTSKRATTLQLSKGTHLFKDIGRFMQPGNPLLTSLSS